MLGHGRKEARAKSLSSLGQQYEVLRKKWIKFHMGYHGECGAMISMLSRGN